MQTIQAPIQILCKSAQELYCQVLQAICESDEIPSINDPRSIGSGWGTRERPTKELRYVTLILENPRDRLINAPTFLLEDAIPRAVLCTLLDTLDLETIGFYNPKAHAFSDDGKTMPSNYGYRIRHLHNTNQIDDVIHQLKIDPHSRRAIIHVHAVRDAEIRYTPCIDSLHFLIRNGALECQSFWRSENALTLLPINIFEFTLLQELIASELEVPVGQYVHTVTSLHYYLDDQQRLDQTLEELPSKISLEPMASMTPGSLQQIEILRNFEKNLRLQLSDGSKEYSEMSDYWKNIAGIIAYTIAKKTCNFASMQSWMNGSLWKALILGR